MRPERPAPLAELVTARLRREIVDGVFEFGEALSESKIAKRYDVSRTPVREAFARLELEGLVETEPPYGTFVFTMDRAEFALISETRAVLEIAALRLAVERAPALLRSAWRDAVATMGDAVERGEAAPYTVSDGAFHEAIFACAQNPYLDAARRSFAAKIATVRSRLGATPEHMARSYGEHVKLLELAEAGETEAAVALLDRHIRHKGASFWSVPKMAPKRRPRRLTELAE